MSSEEKILAELQKMTATIDKAITEKLSPEKIQKMVEDTIMKKQDELAKVKMESQIKKDADEAAQDRADLEKSYKRKGEYSIENAGSDIAGMKNVEELEDNHIVKSYLLKTATNKEEDVSDFQNDSDTLLILKSMKDAHARAHGERYDIRKSRFYQNFRVNHSRILKALESGTATAGNNWIPTMFSAKLIDQIRLGYKVAALFPVIQMPSDPFTLPVKGTDKEAKLVAEATADNLTTGATTAATDPTTNNVTLNAIKLQATTKFSDEISEDSIIAIAPLVRSEHGWMQASAVETAIVNGHTGTHPDTGDSLASTSAEKAWQGLRALTKSGNTVNEGADTLVVGDLGGLIAKLGKYGANPEMCAWITSSAGYALMRTHITQVITKEQYGDQATILSGQLGSILGSPIIVSEKVKQDLDATGFVGNTSASNVKTQILLVNRFAFVLGERRAVTFRAWEDVINEQTVLASSQKKDFQAFFDATTEDLVAYLYNVPLS